MVWNDTTNEQGIVQFVNEYLNITNDDYSLKSKARSANTWLEKASFVLMTGAGYWQVHDSNHTNLPVFTTNLVSGQSTYTLDNTFYSVFKVLIKDKNGNWIDLPQIDIQQKSAIGYLTQSNPSGVPQSYDIYGDQIALDRSPDYSSTGGIKIWVEEKPSYYTGDNSTEDNNKEPGIPNLFAKYIAYGIIFDYAERRSLPNLATIEMRIKEYEADMKVHASRRNKGKRHRLQAYAPKLA